MGIVIGVKNPVLVQSEDVGNLARMNYGKHVAENAIGEEDAHEVAKEDVPEETSEEQATIERIEKLEKIAELPIEEQVAALHEAGFETEAKELAAKIEAEKETETADALTEEVTESSEDNPKQEGQEKATLKKAGRPKKS